MVNNDEIQKRIQSARISLIATIIAMAMSCSALCLIPFTLPSVADKNITFAYIIAAIFWIGIITAFSAILATKIILNKYYKRLVLRGVIKEQTFPGAFNFSFIKPRIVLYLVILIGIILIITDIIWIYVPEMIMFPIIAITILSFTLHCVIDGKYYKVYKLIKESFNNEKHCKK